MAVNARIYLLLEMLLQLLSLLSCMRFLRVCHATSELCHGGHVDWRRQGGIWWRPLWSMLQNCSYTVSIQSHWTCVPWLGLTIWHFLHEVEADSFYHGDAWVKSL